MNAITHQQSSEIDLYNPLNSLFGEYSEVLRNEFQGCSVNVVLLRLS